ncbi:sensor histidine kinase [Ramlibacter sp. PS4R-6]|uniref:sensor histidine kinase n=1 Tax=Ramlibacter sp. PS4R-6 TaxID=3133438 RepID=UPI00309AD42F
MLDFIEESLVSVGAWMNRKAEGVETESESGYRSLFEHNLDGVLFTTPDGTILRANPAACEMLGRTEREIHCLGREGVVDVSDPRLPVLLQRRREARQARGELRFVRADGEKFETEISSSIFCDDRGNERCCIVFRDLSELERARNDLARLNDELEQIVEHRTRELVTAVGDLEAFAYSVSHDLRAPLRTMQGFADVLQQDFGASLPEQGQHYLKRVSAGARKLGQLIDDLLRFSRLGRQEMHAGEIDVDALVKEAVEQVRAHDPDWAGAVVKCALGRCRGDLPMLRQLWVNLIGNAFKYSARKEHPTVEIGCEHRDGTTVYFVKDDGAGFDMAYVGKLFHVFERLHTDAQFPGTGVGLALVKRIVDRHGGRVWAEGAEGAGATFYFTLGSSK